MTGQREDGHSQFIFTIHLIYNVEIDAQGSFRTFITSHVRYSPPDMLSYLVAAHVFSL